MPLLGHQSYCQHGTTILLWLSLSKGLDIQITGKTLTVLN